MQKEYELTFSITNIFGQDINRDILGEIRIVPSTGYSGPAFTAYPADLTAENDTDRGSQSVEEFKESFNRVVSLQPIVLKKSDIVNGILTISLIPSIQYVPETSYELRFEAEVFLFQMPAKDTNFADIMKETYINQPITTRQRLAAEILERKLADQRLLYNNSQTGRVSILLWKQVNSGAPSPTAPSGLTYFPTFYTTLSSSVSVGATTLILPATNKIAVNDELYIGRGTTQERKAVSAKNTDNRTYTIPALTYAHKQGTSVVRLSKWRGMGDGWSEDSMAAASGKDTYVVTATAEAVYEGDNTWRVYHEGVPHKVS